MSELRDDVTSDFKVILTEWPNLHNQTKAKISTMKDYYSNIHDRSEVVEKTDGDRKNLKTDVDR
jgi:hypothetical protein